MAEAWRPWKDWATVAIGVLLFITPFVLGSTGSATAAGTAYVGGVLLVIAGVWTLSTRSVQFSEWAEVLIGVLLFVAPWVLGFSGLTSMALSAWIAGVLAVVLGESVLLGERGRRRMEQH
jgi:SPW repeat